MRVLVLNSGSSSLKAELFDTDRGGAIARVLVERIGLPDARISLDAAGVRKERALRVATHDEAGGGAIDALLREGAPPVLRSLDEIDGVGHRVVHGGERFHASVRIDDAVLEAIEACVPLAPLHNPANLAGIRAMQRLLPGKLQVAVFDTAFFQTMPPVAFHYGVPRAWYERHGVRRYGFHGTSHRYVAARAAEALGIARPDLVTLHLGNGCSMACIQGGIAIDATMGLTPLEGLVMGTRSGDVDPALVFHLVHAGVPLDEIHETLERGSGLLGLSGVSSDLRDVERAAASGNARAALALDVFAHRARKYVGAFLAELGSCHALVFTAGIGENSASMRARILAGLAPLGLVLDPERNAADSRGPRRIDDGRGRAQVWVIPTDEELQIARDVVALAGDA
ncbi:MAG TPA: acetate kinase [Myxococcota bacterium]|nr:acetate kinase [Myxococcota bacterium]